METLKVILLVLGVVVIGLAVAGLIYRALDNTTPFDKEN